MANTADTNCNEVGDELQCRLLDVVIVYHMNQEFESKVVFSFKDRTCQDLLGNVIYTRHFADVKFINAYFASHESNVSSVYIMTC